MWKMKNVGIKITAAMLCVILLGIIAALGVGTYKSGTVTINETLGKLKSDTHRESLIMDEWFAYHKASVNSMAAALSQLNDYSREQVESILKAVLNHYEDYQDVFMGFPDNTAIMGSGFTIENEYHWWRATERD
jgi:hypothetical protein